MISYRRRRRPPLNRLARYLRWTAILALVLVIVFIASTIYSAVLFATHLNLSGSQAGGYTFDYTSSGGFTATVELNLTNAGYYPLVLDLSAVAATPQGPLIPYSTSGPVTIGPGNRTTTVALTLDIPSATLASDGASMLLNDTPLLGHVWLNGSFAWIYQFGLSVGANGTWGAPFANLTVTPGAPVGAGGQTTVPVGVTFTNDAFFSDVGNLTFQVVNGGSNCGAPAVLPINAASHQYFSGTVNVTGPSSCLVPGATVLSTYTLGTLVIPLPPVRIG